MDVAALAVRKHAIVTIAIGPVPVRLGPDEAQPVIEGFGSVQIVAGYDCRQSVGHLGLRLSSDESASTCLYGPCVHKPARFPLIESTDFVMSEMFRITLPDGSVREVAPGTTPADIAAAIGPGLAKAALAAQVDGELRDLMRPFEGDANLALVTARDEADALELARHDYRACAGRGGAEPVPRHADHLRPVDRRRLLL